jgi:hypothetical protein
LPLRFVVASHWLGPGRFASGSAFWLFMAIVDTDLNDLTNKLQAMSEAAAVAESDLQCSFDWGGTLMIPCVGYPQYESRELTEGGWRTVRRVKIKFRFVALPGQGALRPARNHIITYRASLNGPETRYKIVAVRNFFDVIGELECEDSNTD